MIKFENQNKYVLYQNIVKCLFPFVDGNSVYQNHSNWIPWDYYKAVIIFVNQGLKLIVFW